MSSSASVTIPYSEFQAIQEARQKAEERTAQLETELRTKQIAANDPTTHAIARAALGVARFAIGNLPPEATRGWPIDQLRILADELPKIAGATVDDTELALTIRIFAQDCETCEKQRSSRT